MRYQDGLDQIMANINIVRETVCKQINQLPEGDIKLYTRKRKGKEYTAYSQILEDGRSIYITKNKKLIQALTVKKFLLMNLSLIDHYMERLEKAMQAAEMITINNILKEIPEKLKNYLIFDEGDISIKTQAASVERKIAAFLSMQYQSNDFDGNKQTTSDGTVVKSKSELIIYELLIQYNITFRYEMPIEINGVVYHPDFTIILPNGKVIYWEHAGMMTNERYRKRHKDKMAVYEIAGIVPWDNLIVTYDDIYGNININIIKSEIENKLLGCCEK